MSTQTSDDRLVTLAVVLLGALLVLPLLFVGLGRGGYGMMGTWGGHMWAGGTGMTGWAFLLWTLVRFLVLAALVAGGYLLYRSVTGDDRDAAMAELRRAYARGDLSDEEFERRRETLERED
jgi:putative membrane protein